MKKSVLFTLFMVILGSTALTPVNAQDDLIYVAVDPCRIVDTRNAGGNINANNFRKFRVSGTSGELAVQGGTSDCLAPKAATGQEPLAVSAYVVAVPEFGSTSGVLTAYPSDQQPPPVGSGSTVNFAAQQIIGNTTNITLCNPAGSCPADGEFAILSRNTNQHVVIDVQGYFYPASSYQELIAMINALDDRVADLEVENNALQTALDNEVSARISGDNNLGNDNDALQTALDHEISARIAGDNILGGENNALQTALDNEIAARITGDNSLQSQIDGLDATLLEGRVANLEGRLMCVSDASTSFDIFFEGCNVHVRNGVGTTDSINGQGNLIVGYNSDSYVFTDKTGSHNIVVGDQHNYSSYGGLVAGFRNTISGDSASVTGGRENLASGSAASVSGGQQNTASGQNSSSVSGGAGNTASDLFSSVSGGRGNVANSIASSVSGGRNNMASGGDSSVSGGFNNTASGFFSSVSGGEENSAIGETSSVSAGTINVASGRWASVSGGQQNTASGFSSSVSGGTLNIASGIPDGSTASSVSGGAGNEASGYNATISGGSNNEALGAYDSATGGSNNVASGGASTVLGGNANTASGGASTVSGGSQNFASGSISAISGGLQNIASGILSGVSGGSECEAMADRSWGVGDTGFGSSGSGCVLTNPP